MKRLFATCSIILITLTNCKKHDGDSAPAAVPAIEFTISADSIQVNPYGFTPLSALVSFTTEKMGRTFLRVHGKHGAFSDVTHLFTDFGTAHSIPVIGMYADTVNTVDIRLVDNAGDTLEKSTVSITTQALPADMPVSITTLPFNQASVESGVYLVSNLSTLNIVNRPCLPYMSDDYGDVRWVLDYSTLPALSTMFYDDGIARLQNGNFYFGDIETSAIYEVNLLGKIINTWPLPGYSFHHNVQEKPNGNFLVSVSKQGSTNTEGHVTIEDYIIEINRQSGSVQTEWDLKESLDEYRRTLVNDAGDWVHVNSVIYDSTDNTIVVSGRTQGVIKLDSANGVKWILAPHTGWGQNRRGEDLNAFLLTPVDASGKPYTDSTVINGTSAAADFEWCYYQHSNIYLPNGDLMVFDNGTSRNLDAVDGNTIVNSAPGKYSRAVEYKIDEKNKTIQQVWDYGKERDQSCYSSIISSVQYLPEKNHILFCPGYNVLNTTGNGGKIVEIDYATKQVVAETSISTANTFGFHRAKKISAYPDNL